MKFKKMKKLSDRMKYIRANHNFSQAELAEIAGTTQQAIQQAESGKARQPRYLNHLARELDIPTDWILFGEPVKDITDFTQGKKGMHDRSSEVLDKFFSMPKSEQKLIYELMKTRKEK